MTDRRPSAGRLLAVADAQQGIQLYNPFSARRERESGAIPEQPDSDEPDQIRWRRTCSLRRSTRIPTGDRPAEQLLQHQRPATSHGDQGDVKLDYNLSEKDHISGRYSQSFLQNPEHQFVPAVLRQLQRLRRPKTESLNWTHTFWPTLVNEFRTGVNYVQLNNGSAFGQRTRATSPQTLGIAERQRPGPRLAGPEFQRRLSRATSGLRTCTQLFADTVIQVQDTRDLDQGKHIVHTGFQFMRQRINTYYSGNNGRPG